MVAGPHSVSCSTDICRCVITIVLVSLVPAARAALQAFLACRSRHSGHQQPTTAAAGLHLAATLQVLLATSCLVHHTVLWRTQALKWSREVPCCSFWHCSYAYTVCSVLLVAGRTCKHSRRLCTSPIGVSSLPHPCTVLFCHRCYCMNMLSLPVKHKKLSYAMLSYAIK